MEINQVIKKRNIDHKFLVVYRFHQTNNIELSQGSLAVGCNNHNDEFEHTKINKFGSLALSLFTIFLFVVAHSNVPFMYCRLKAIYPRVHLNFLCHLGKQSSTKSANTVTS